MAFAVPFGFGSRDAAERRPRNRRSGDVRSYVAIAECVVPTLVPKPRSLTVTQGNLRCQESAAKRLVGLPWVTLGYVGSWNLFTENPRVGGSIPPLATILFIQKSYNPFSPNSLCQVFSRIYIAAGVKGATSHSGRRKFITKWAQRKLEFRCDAYPLLGMNSGRVEGEFDIGHGAATGDRCDNQQHAGLAVRVVSAKAWA